MGADVLLEVTGLFKGALAVGTLVGSVHGARLPQVLVEHGVSGQLLDQACTARNRAWII